MSKTVSIKLKEEVLKKIDFISKRMNKPRDRIIEDIIESYLEDLYDLEDAKNIILNKNDEIIPHEEAKKEILSD